MPRSKDYIAGPLRLLGRWYWKPPGEATPDAGSEGIATSPQLAVSKSTLPQEQKRPMQGELMQETQCLTPWA